MKYWQVNHLTVMSIISAALHLDITVTAASFGVIVFSFAFGMATALISSGYSDCTGRIMSYVLPPGVVLSVTPS